MKDEILEKDGLDLYIWSKHLEGVDPNNLPINSDGQIVIHTGVYLWKDGTYHTTKENKSPHEWDKLILSPEDMAHLKELLKEIDKDQ